MWCNMMCHVYLWDVKMWWWVMCDVIWFDVCSVIRCDVMCYTLFTKCNIFDRNKQNVWSLLSLALPAHLMPCDACAKTCDVTRCDAWWDVMWRDVMRCVWCVWCDVTYRMWVMWCDVMCNVMWRNVKWCDAPFTHRRCDDNLTRPPTVIPVCVICDGCDGCDECDTAVICDGCDVRNMRCVWNLMCVMCVICDVMWCVWHVRWCAMRDMWYAMWWAMLLPWCDHTSAEAVLVSPLS